MALYEFHTVTQVIAAFGDNHVMFEANSNRVSLIINFENGGAAGALGIKNKQVASLWARLAEPQTKEFPYRDYGPIIKDAIVVGDAVAATTVRATEVVKVPGS